MKNKMSWKKIWVIKEKRLKNFISLFLILFDVMKHFFGVVVHAILCFYETNP